MVIVPDPAFEPAALNVQFSVAPLPLMVQGFGVKVNEAVGATGVLVVDVLVLEEVDVLVLEEVDVLDPGTVVVVEELPGMVVVVEELPGMVVVVVDTDVAVPTPTTIATAFALVPHALRLRSRTKYVLDGANAWRVVAALPVSKTRMSVRPGAEPTSRRYDVGAEPDVGGLHCKSTVLPMTDALNAAGASGAEAQARPTLTTISLEGTLMSLKSILVLRTRAKYTPSGYAGNGERQRTAAEVGDRRQPEHRQVRQARARARFNLPRK